MIHSLATLLTVFSLSTLAAEAPASPTGDPGALQVVAQAEAPADPPETPPAPPEPAPTASPEACREQAIDRIQSRYEDVRDLEAGFTQTTRPARMANSIAQETVSTGRMVVAKPGKMRWSYETPQESLVVSDGESLWIYDAAYGEAQKLPVTDGFLSGAAIEFLLGEGDMRRDFEIALAACEADRVTLTLTPKKPASYAQLQLVADPKTGDLFETRVDDLLGNVTTVVFEGLRVNRSPDASTFRFVAPEGVDVVEIEAP